MAGINPTQLANSNALLASILEKKGNEKDLTKLIYSIEQINADESIDSNTVFVIGPQGDPFSTYRLLAKMAEVWPGSKMIVVIGYYHTDFIQDLVTQGVLGVISIDSVKEKLASAIATVSLNNLYVDTTINNRFGKRDADEQLDLSPREQQIIVFIVQGLTSPEIADKLCLSEHTIKSHRKLINKKLQVHSPAQLVKYAIDNDLYF